MPGLSDDNDDSDDDDADDEGHHVLSLALPGNDVADFVSFRFSVAQIFHELRCTVYGNQDLLMYSNQDLLSQRETDLSPSLAVSGFWLFPASPNLSSGQMAQYKHTNANTQIQVRKYKYTRTNRQIQIHK